MADSEDISTNKFLNQTFPQLGSYLKSIDSERKENFNNSFNILIGKMLFKFGFVIFDDSFTNQFASLNSSLIDDHFVVFSKLDLVVLNCFI